MTWGSADFGGDSSTVQPQLTSSSNEQELAAIAAKLAVEKSILAAKQHVA